MKMNVEDNEQANKSASKIKEKSMLPLLVPTISLNNINDVSDLNTRLYIPQISLMGSKVLSLPSLDVNAHNHYDQCETCTSVSHQSLRNVNHTNVVQSCKISSHTTSSSSSASLSNHSGADISLTVPGNIVDDSSTSSSLSPSHCKLKGVPSKAAAILGANEIFTSPSHAAYRRLVDYTHRPLHEGMLLQAEDSKLPSMAHVSLSPSLTVRAPRKIKHDNKLQEVSPERKNIPKYKIINIGIDDMKENMREKLNFLKKSSDLGQQLMSGYPSNYQGQQSGSGRSSSGGDGKVMTKYGRVTTQQILKWSQSFDQLLNDKYGLALFHEYLRSEYSEENIEFWIACEEFKKVASNPKKMAIKAHKIIQDFVCTQASKEINLDSKSRQLTLDHISHPHPNMFDTAQKRIQSLMEIDSYQRFLRSDLFMALQQRMMQSSSNNTPTTSTTSNTTTSQSKHGSSHIVRISSMKSPTTIRMPQADVSDYQQPSTTTNISGMHSSSSDNCLPQSINRN